MYLKIQHVHHKTLKVIYRSNKTCEELLELSETVSIHQRHLRFLVTEVYKSTSYLKPKFMSSFFTHKEIPYNLRKGQVLSLPLARSIYYGTNSVHFQGSLIWNNLPSYRKSSRSVCAFKNNIKNFRITDCGCLITEHEYYACSYIPAGKYMFKVNKRNTRTGYEVCSKLTIKIPERCVVLASLLLTLNIFQNLF